MAGEPIRLVIWDLDETFWRGALSEGGIAFVEAHGQLVKDLAARGIMSSICSRNSYDEVRDVLVEKNLWDCFVFPSIDWSAKPERVREIVEATQLRPETVLFVDDNPMNRAAVAAANPGLRVAPETFVAQMDEHPLLQGKRDDQLTRLKQYKLMETRGAERRLAADPTEFLRASGIKVAIEVELAPHYERIVELINRTNQLNFTKRRLSDDLAVAVGQLKGWLAQGAPWIKAGLVRVSDNYGDYGYCGFYAQQEDRLDYFCFSCRVLGFGVETWLYARLGKPKIEIEGEVLVDLASAPKVDWIALERVGEARPVEPREGGTPLGLRGRCEVGLLLQYLRFAGFDVQSEGACREGLMEIYSDSAINMFYTSGSRWARTRAELERLGFSNHRGCRAFDAPGRPVLFFTHRDFLNPPFLYRHKTQDIVLCLGLTDYARDLITSDFDEIAAHIGAREPAPERARAEMGRIEHLRAAYELIDPTGEETAALVRRALRGLLDDAPADALLMPVLMHPQARGTDGSVWEFKQIRNSREALTQTLGADPRVRFIDASDCLRSADEIVDWLHYDRVVYHRMTKLVVENCEARRVPLAPLEG